MSAHHTPGPWKAVTDPFRFNTLSTVVGGGHAEKGLQSAMRAMIVEVGGYAHWQEQEANARLIAAAPDMLAALNTLKYAGCPQCSGDCGAANPPVSSEGRRGGKGGGRTGQSRWAP